MNRAFWFVAGAGASLYAVLRARRTAEMFTAEGLRDRAQAVGLGARLLREELAAGRAEAEIELRERLLAPYDSTPQLAAAPAAGHDPHQIDPIDQIDQQQEGTH